VRLGRNVKLYHTAMQSNAEQTQATWLGRCTATRATLSSWSLHRTSSSMTGTFPTRQQLQQSENIYTKFTDPCSGAAKASMECLNRNSYDKEKCSEFFKLYRDCKKEWMDRRQGRQGKGE